MENAEGREGPSHRRYGIDGIGGVGVEPTFKHFIRVPLTTGETTARDTDAIWSRAYLLAVIL
jgi:hypothetical protein